METQQTNMPMLELLLRPAFCVSQGRITRINGAAASYLLNEGTDILPLLATGAEEYQAFTQGSLSLTLSICGQTIGATVVALNDEHLFLLEQPGERTELRSLALAARELRVPLAGINATASQLTNADPAQLAQLNRRMHQMMRIVSNMSDADLYCNAAAGQMEYTEICSFLQELLCKTASQLSQAQIQLEYDLPSAPIYTLADIEKLERAVYNLISNAAKHTSPGGKITLRLAHRGRLYLSVTDDGPRMDQEILANAYSRYLRTPSVLDVTEGIGLGMVLVKATATLHGGTVLIDHPEGRGNRVTMSLQLLQDQKIPVRSPIMRIDYAGERDHGLQELSDILPTHLYVPEKT